MSSHTHKKHFSIMPLTSFCAGILIVTSIFYHLNKPEKILSNEVEPFSTNARHVTFAFAGDYGANKNTEKVFSLINNLKPDFHIVLGDLSYNEVKPESAWCDLVRKFVPETPIVLLSGNHESDGYNGEIEKFADCLPFDLFTNLNGEYTKDFYFDYPEAKPLARFIMISPDIIFADGVMQYRNNSASMKRVISEIDEAKEKNIPWIIVGAHKPCLSTEVKHHCETGPDLPKELIEKGVDLYINGHSHIYQRTFMLSCIDDKEAVSGCIDKGQGGIFKKGLGTIFVTTGVGGVEIRKTDSSSKLAPFFASTHSANNDPVFGLSVVNIEEDSLELKFIDAKTGGVVDYFKIQKDGSN